MSLPIFHNYDPANPWTITGESHTVAANGTVRLTYVPLKGSVSIPGYTETTNVTPGLKEFYIDYQDATAYRTAQGIVQFSASAASASVSISYQGVSQLLLADYMNEIKSYIDANVFGDNENTLRSNFSGATQPSDPVVGQQWYDTVNSKMWQYNGAAWVPIDTNSTTQVDVSNAKGSLTNLTSYLRVAHNDDGTLKTSPATAIGEFKDNTLVITYVSPTSFTVPTDFTSIFTANRKLKIYLESSTAITYVSSSSYNSGTNVTTVVTGEAVLNSSVTAIKYSIIQYGMPQDYNLALEESTGYGVISGGSATASGLIVTIAAVIAHMPNGNRYSLPQSTVTVNAADATNPRIDLIYLSSAGVVSYLTGTAAASPNLPSVTNGGLALWEALVTVDGTVKLTDLRGFKARYKNMGIVNVKDWGAAGDGTTDDTIAIKAALCYAIQSGRNLYIPKGIYCYTDLGNIAYSGLTIKGENDRKTVLKCISDNPDHTALLFDAFPAETTIHTPFVQRCNLKNITVEGNYKTANIISAQGLARCNWENVVARCGNADTGKAFYFRGMMLNNFRNLICSTEMDTMESIPHFGIYLTHGVRAGKDIGSSTNNVFESAYMEGMAVGIAMSLADQNVFIGGSAESCGVYGLVIDVGGRYNTFIGTGFENNQATADITDSGVSNKYINCYSSKSIILQGRGCEISGGFFEKVDVQSSGVKNSIYDITLNYFNSGNGGLYDYGVQTKWRGIYDYDALSYVYPVKPRVSISPSGSPFTWENTTGEYVDIIIQTGTISSINLYRKGVVFIAPPTVPGKILMAPTDIIKIEYSVEPLLSYLPQNF